MDGRQKPDADPENKNDLNDDEIIDLTKVLQDGDNDDIINLTEVLEQPDRPAALTDDNVSEAAIPLTDAIASDEAADISQENEDDIIDLTNMEVAAETAADDLPASSMEEDGEAPEEEIIDLMDVATTLESEISATEIEGSDVGREVATEPEEDEEEIIDLMDVATAAEPGGSDAAAPEAMVEDTVAPDEDQDEIIDLLEVTTPVEPETAQMDHAAADEAVEADEEIIDLTDVAPTAPAALESESQAPEIAPAETVVTEDEEPIELTDVASPEESQTAEAEVDVDQPAIGEADLPDEDEFADLENRADAMLTDTVAPLDFETPLEAAETAGPDAEFGLLETESLAEEADGPEPVKAADAPAGEAMFAPATTPGEPALPEAPSLTAEQVDDALTRVIEKVYGEKIEQLMLQTIEKTVTREIEKIKAALLENDDGFGA